GRLPAAARCDRHQHRRQYAERALLRRGRYDRRHPGACHRKARSRNQNGCDRRSGAPYRIRIQVPQDGRPASHARRPANDLGTQSPGVNYFNYFTEIEEHFQRARGTGLFLLSPLDWALIESWNTAGVPLEAVLRGIDESFEKWRSRKVKTQKVNS